MAVLLGPAHAASVEQTPKPAAVPTAKAKPALKAPELRLSDWLLQQPVVAGDDPYYLGLSLRLPEEVPAQTGLKLELVAALAGADKAVKADAAAIKRLRDWVAGLPVTGRVPVANADGRWLQVNPAHNPVLTPGYRVVLPQRPRTVTVITNEGNRCAIVHQAGREAKAYIERCRPAGAARSDWAWIAQPDGRVQRFGVALWNEQKQDEPAVGAWIWAPGRNSGWPDTFSERFIRFLATQGPAPDAPEATGGPSPSAVSGEEKDAAAAAGGQGTRGATRQATEGLVLSGGMSLGLSESFLAERPPDSPPAPQQPRSEPLILRDEERTQRSRSPEVTASDWGTVGLFQTPTARMREVGHLTGQYSHMTPYGHGSIIFQPFEWMEAGFRYTDISNRPYSAQDVSDFEGQSFKDKGFDVKFRAWKESAYLPEVAVGFRDLGGTGLFSGEYIVANKRTRDFDWSLGLGWGYVGGRGDIRNPLSVFSSKFDTRVDTQEVGGELSFGRYFRGPTALFGGVQYQTPWQPLIVKVEYDGNDYRNEPLNNSLPQRSPINAGLVYRAWPGVDLSLGYQRGNTVMFGVTLHTNLSRLTQPKLSDPKPIPVVDTRPTKPPDWSRTAQAFKTQTDWTVRGIEQRENDVRVVVEDAGAAYWGYRLDRGTAVLHRDAPADVDRFTVTYRTAGVDTAEHVVDRQAWVAQRTQPQLPSERREAVVARAPEPESGGTVVHAGTGSPVFEHGLRLSYAQTLGGPDAFVLWQLGLVESARLRLREDTWLQGSVRLRLADNYEKFKVDGPSSLPPVRTLLRQYLTTSQVTLPNFQLTHVGKLGENHFYSAYGGYLEEMFAGAGAEWLYRPFASSLAVGVDVNAVRQREVEQHFALMDYGTVTGHATMYWDTGWNDVMVKISAGRYLAKDVGATLQVSRTFRNGVVMGAFATKTNVSAEEFGEGSFDKGIFVSVPFDAIFTRTSRTNMYTLWRPLTRDGGAPLHRNVQLYNLTSARSDRVLWQEPAPLPNEMLKAVDQRVEHTPNAEVVKPYTRVTPKPPASNWERPGSLDQHRLVTSLYAQSFRNIKVDYDTSHRVLVSAGSERLHPIGRAVGRIARTALLQAPLEARGIEITLMDGTTRQARYEFFDLPRLRRYLDGEINADELRPFVRVEWINPAAAVRDPLAGLDDLNPEASVSPLAALVPDTFSVSRVASDYVAAAQGAKKVDWVSAGALGAGAVLSASLLDTRAFRQASDHADSRSLKQGVRIADALPLAGLGIAGLMALDGSDPRRSRTGYSAVEAGVTSYALTLGLKYVVGRARPDAGLGHRSFNPGKGGDERASFPSGHTMAAWSLATPFALEYDMPWLYGVAAITNLGRIASREHWLSDTVASSLIGYGLGRVFWQSAREQAKGDPKVMFDGSSLSFLWDW